MTRPSLAGIEPFSATPWLFQPWGGQNQNGDYAESILLDAHGEALAYGLPNGDGALIAAAPDLLAAVRDVLAQHTPVQYGTSPLLVCQHCRTGQGNRVAHPCATRRALATHLDLTDPEGEPT